MSPKTCVLQTWPRLSSVFKQQCVFLGGCFIPLLCTLPTLAAHRADDLHVHRGESEKPPNCVFHSGTAGDIFMTGRVRRLLHPLSVRSLKVWQPWRSREGWEKIEQAGKCKENCPSQPCERTKTAREARINLGNYAEWNPWLWWFGHKGTLLRPLANASVIVESGLAACQ